MSKAINIRKYESGGFVPDLSGYATKQYVDDAIREAIAANSHFKGYFDSLQDLRAACPESQPGDYAYVYVIADGTTHVYVHNPDKVTLPEGYTRIQYVMKSGHNEGYPYFDTGLTLQSDYRITADAMVSGIGDSIFSAIEYTYQRLELAFGGSKVMMRYPFYLDATYESLREDKGINLLDGALHRFYFNPWNVRVDGVTIAVFRADTVKEGDLPDWSASTAPLYIFRGSDDGIYHGTLGMMKISDRNGQRLLRHYVAARRDTDGELGFYDVVEDVFCLPIFHPSAGPSDLSGGAALPEQPSWIDSGATPFNQ